MDRLSDASSPIDPQLHLHKEIGEFIKKPIIYKRRFNTEFKEEGYCLIDSLEFPEHPQKNYYILGHVQFGEVHDLVNNCCGLIIKRGLENKAVRVFKIHDLHQRVLDSFEANKDYGDTLLALNLFKTKNTETSPERIDLCEHIKLHGISYDEYALWARLIKYSEIVEGERKNFVLLDYIYSEKMSAVFDKFAKAYNHNLSGLTGKEVVYAMQFAYLAQDILHKRSKSGSSSSYKLP